MPPIKDKKTIGNGRTTEGGEPAPPTMEESVIVLPMIEDGVIGLGDLYDCRTNLCPGNIFGEPITPQYLEAHPMQCLEYTMYKSQNSRDKLDTLNVKAEMKLDICGGMIKVSGSATYDSKESKNFNEEELICTYNSSTYVVRVKPSSVALVDVVMKDNIIKKKVNATHFVQSIRVGGQAFASIRYRENIEDNNMTIDGQFNGDLVIGPVTASAEATMKMLDSELIKQYRTTVSVKASPRFKKAPMNVTEMFNEIEKIDQNISDEDHFPDLGAVTGRKIVGVPLSFKLVPLAQLIDFGLEARYRIMADEIMDNFLSMITSCTDFEQPGYIKSLLRGKDARLVTILRDESNPFTQKVTKMEMECRMKAKDVKRNAFTVFAEYKNGGKDEMILDAIKYGDEHFNIILTMAKIMEMVGEARSELTGIHASDVKELEGKPKFFSNEVDLADWWTAERTIKLFLQTNLTTASPSGTFLKLFNLSGHLAKLGVEIGIAFPNISKDFSLTFKIHDKEVVYKDGDIVFALDVLAVAVESGETMSSLYYVLNGVLSGLNMTSVAENLPDITSLVSIFKESRGATICESYPQLLETLGTTQDTWNFVIPLQGANCSIEMMKFFRQLREILPENYPKVKHRWIVGRFNVDKYDSPLLFVFRDQELRAICLDRLDVLILMKQLKESANTPDLAILSHENLKTACFYPDRANFALKIIEGLVLDHSTTLTNLIPPLPKFLNEVSKQLDMAIKVTRTAAMRNELNVLNTVSMASKEDYHDLESTFKKFGWTDEGFPAIIANPPIEWKELLKDLEAFLGNQAPYLVKVEGAIKVLRGLKVPEDGNAADVKKLKENIAENVKFIAPEFGSTRNSEDDGHKESYATSYNFRGKVINEEEKYAELKPIILSFAPSEVSVRLRGVLNAFEKFYDDELADDENNFFNLVQLIALVGKLASKEGTFKPVLIDLAKKYCDRALAKLDECEYPGASKKIKDSIAERNLFKALGYLASFIQHPYIYEFTEKLYNLKTLNNVEPVIEMVEYMRAKEFTDEQLRDIWKNPKFLFLVRQGMENIALIQTIFIHLCLEKGKVPRFIPVDIADKLKPLFHSMQDPEFDWATTWKDIDTVIQVFQIICTRKFIPSLFPRILRQHMELREDLRLTFVRCDALFYWDNKEKYFIHPWSLSTIQKALELLMAGSTSKPEPEPEEVRDGPKAKLKKSTSVLPHKSETSSRTANRQLSEPPVLDKQTLQDLALVTTLNLPVNDAWKRFTIGGYLNRAVGTEFNKIRKLLAKPLVEYDELVKTADEILPYLIQQAKMHNSATIQPPAAVDYIKYPPTDGKPRPGYIDFLPGIGPKRATETADKFLMSKGDLMTAIFNCTDPLVSHHILCSMMKTTMALPLIIPGIVAASNGFKFILPALQNLIVNELEGIVPDPHLLAKPFRLVLTLRVGDVSKVLGRSTILNQLLMADQNLYSSASEPGAEYGKPISRPGLVEFVWLSRSKVKSAFYDAVVGPHYKSNQPHMVLLGNLHGDALTFQPMLELLKTFTSSFVIFWKANNWNDLNSKKIELNKIIGAGSSVLDLVIYPDATIIEHVDDQNIINISAPEESKVKLHNVFKEAIACKPRMPDSHMTNLSQLSASGHPSQDQVEDDPGILNFFRQRRTSGGIPGFIKAKISMSEDENISCPESLALIEFIRVMTVQRVKEALIARSPYEDPHKMLLDQLTELFLAILELPLEKRDRALTHFNYELGYQSRKSSQLAVQRVLKLRKELESYQGVIDAEETDELQNDIKSVQTRLEVTTLTMQDILRYMINKDSLTVIPGKYAEYLQSGNVVEIFQPTYGETLWSKPLTSALESIPSGTRIFVVSAIGLKAAGKSTLLNRLFGDEFREGPTGCTNGLQMRFLWIDERIRKELKCDAFCVIDTEGFGAAENTINENADLYERDFASFILGVSHLVIANLLGNSMKELQDILEVSFATLTRIRNMDLTPDLLLVHQQVEIPETNIKVDSPILEEWKTMMSNVRTLTRENEMAIGVRVREAYRMETVRSRVKHDELTHIIRPLSNIELVNSTQYHVDVQNLLFRIINHCKNSTQIMTIGDWYEFTQIYWNTIKERTTPNAYKNSKETKAAIVLDTGIRNVKRAIDLAFRKHEKDIDDIFTKALDKYLDPEESLDWEVNADPKLGQILIDVHKSLADIVNTCPEENGEGCAECRTALTLREAIFEQAYGRGKQQFSTTDNVNDYMGEVRESLWRAYKQRVIARQIETGIIREGMRDEIHTVYAEIMAEHPDDLELAWVKYKQFISTTQSVIPSNQQIDAEVTMEFSSLPHILNRLTEKHALPNLESIVAFDFGHYNKAVESSLNSPKREILTWDQNDWLVAQMEDLPRILLTDNGVKRYLTGMVRDLQGKMNDVLETFQQMCGEQLDPNFKWEAHLYAIKYFRGFFDTKQAEWDQLYNPLVQLEKKRDVFDDLFYVI